MASTTVKTLSIKSSLFTSFVYNGLTYSMTPGHSTSYMINHLGGITMYAPEYRVNTGTALLTNFTYEIQLISNGTVAVTTGQLAAIASKNSDNTYNYYTCPNYNSSISYYVVLTDPWTDGRPVVVRFLIRIGNTIVNTIDINSFSFPSTSSIDVSAQSTVQTGQVYPVTLIGTQANSNALFSPIICAYVTDGNQSGAYNYYYWYGYLNEGTTVINNYTYSTVINTLKFYVPYIPDRAHTYSFGWVKLKYAFDTSSSFTSSSCEITLEYNITWSYVNQHDNAAGPILTNCIITENPSGLLTRYGKYIGGGISKLNFRFTYTSRYGQQCTTVTYKLYNAITSALLNTWTFNVSSSLDLTLNASESDKSEYVTATVATEYGAETTYTYPTYQIYAYSYPNIISFNASRCNQDGTPNDLGAYCKITYQFKVSPLGNQNSKKVTLVAPDGSHVYTNLDYNHGSAYEYISAADIEHSYNLSLTVEDDFMTVSASRSISTAGVIMDFLYDGKGIGLGKVAETSEMIEVNPDWVFKCETMTFKGIDLQSILESLGYVFPT